MSWDELIGQIGHRIQHTKSNIPDLTLAADYLNRHYMQEKGWYFIATVEWRGAEYTGKLNLLTKTVLLLLLILSSRVLGYYLVDPCSISTSL